MDITHRRNEKIRKFEKKRQILVRFTDQLSIVQPLAYSDRLLFN